MQESLFIKNLFKFAQMSFWLVNFTNLMTAVKFGVKNIKPYQSYLIKKKV